MILMQIIALVHPSWRNQFKLFAVGTLSRQDASNSKMRIRCTQLAILFRSGSLKELVYSAGRLRRYN